MRAVKINEAGYFAEDIPGDPPYANAPGTAPAPVVGHGFMRPRWNGKEWEEGEMLSVVAEAKAQDEKNKARAWRNAELVRMDNPYRDAQQRQQAERVNAIAAYAVALRDWPRAQGWPNVERPKAPE